MGLCMTRGKKVSIGRCTRYLISHHENQSIKINTSQPGMSGIEIRKLLANQYKETHIPILTLKGNSLIKRRNVNFSRIVK